MEQLTRVLRLHWRCGSCNRLVTYGHRCDHRDFRPDIEPLEPGVVHLRAA